MLWFTLRKLNSSNAEVRKAAIQELGCSREVKAVMPIIDALKDGDPAVREAAVSALGQMQDRRAIEPLAALFHDRESYVARKAIKTFSQLADLPSIGPLLDLLITNHSWAAEEALDVIDQKWRFSAAARNAALVFSKDLAHPNTEVRHAAARAIITIGDESLAETFEKYLTNTHSDMREYAATFLGSIRYIPAVPRLMELVNDENVSVRFAAAKALGLIGDSRATETLTSVLNENTWALPSLASCGDAHAIHALVQYYLHQEKNYTGKNNPNAAGTEAGLRSEPLSVLEKILLRCAKNASAQDLSVLAKLENLEYPFHVEYDSSAYGSGTDKYEVCVDASRVRDLARQEISRRAKA